MILPLINIKRSIINTPFYELRMSYKLWTSMRIKVEFSHVFGQFEFFPVRLLFPHEIYIKKTSGDSHSWNIISAAKEISSKYRSSFLHHVLWQISTFTCIVWIILRLQLKNFFLLCPLSIGHSLSCNRWLINLIRWCFLSTTYIVSITWFFFFKCITRITYIQLSTRNLT